MAGQAAVTPILGALHQQPGLGVLELARSTGHAPMTIMAALATLQDDRLVKSVWVGSTKRHYLTGRPLQRSVPHHLRDLHQALVARGQVTPLDAIHLFPNVPELTVRHRLGQLVRHRWALVSRGGNRLLYRPAIDPSEDGLPCVRRRKSRR